MITKIKKRQLLGLSFIICHLSFSAALLSCSDWDGHYEDQLSQTGSEQTLWQAMRQRSELSDFCEVLQQTKVYKHHKKTSVSYADLLDGVQAFTVLAPVNGTFNKDSLLSLVSTNRGDSMVERSFVGNHLSYNLGSSVSTPTELFLLNSKRMTIENNQVLGVPITEANVHVKGGVLHVLQNTVPYRYNLYEAMISDPRYAAIGEQFASYEDDEFLPTQSVEGDMVDGEQIYSDSVFRERNLLLERIGQLAAEDSSYIFVVPEAQEWQRVWDEAMSYFRFDPTMEDADSLQRLWANHKLLEDAVFSRTILYSPADSLINYSYDKKYPQYHVFRKPFEPGGILYGTEAKDYSNGTLYTTSKWPYTPEMTYHRELRSEGEHSGLIVGYDLCTYSSRTVVADSVSENGYLVITPRSSTSNWNVSFKVENTLSGAYDICAVILPQTVYDPRVSAKSCKFKATVNYVDENGEEQAFNCDNTVFQNDPLRVDTVVLAENFVFPTCNYGETNLKVSVNIACFMMARENAQFSREMYLDCIYLRPRKSVKE